MGTELFANISPASNTNQTVSESAPTSHRQMPHASAQPLDKTNADKDLPSLPSDLIPRISSTDTDKTLPEEASEALSSRTRVPAKRKELSSNPVNAEHVEPLRQGTSTFKEYFLMANRLVATLPPRSSPAKGESDFVEMFVRGLAHHEERRTLVTFLQHRDLWTMVPSTDGGKETILVRWLDFKEAVRRSKLLEVTQDIETVSNVETASDATKSSKKQEKGPKPKKKRRLYL